MLILTFVPVAFAQGMMGNWNYSSPSATSNDQTAQEEAEGKAIWDKLQAKQLECKNLTDDNFDVLGEYFMGQSIGNTQRHAFMNQMMKNMMGETGETQAHITLGKRASGCDPTASFPHGTGWFPMMGMMGGWGGGVNPMFGFGWNNMMGGWGGLGLGFGMLGMFYMLIFWVVIIVGVVYLFRFLSSGSTPSRGSEKSPLDILKERYAKGEITKKEFEEMKKDLSS